MKFLLFVPDSRVTYKYTLFSCFMLQKPDLYAIGG